jgi:hypothetical protein
MTWHDGGWRYLDELVGLGTCVAVSGRRYVEWEFDHYPAGEFYRRK